MYVEPKEEEILCYFMHKAPLEPPIETGIPRKVFKKPKSDVKCVERQNEELATADDSDMVIDD